jgi:hypothetical protein
MPIARASAAALLIAALAPGPSSAASDEPDGITIVATAYDEVPAAATFEVQVAEESALRYEIEEMLKATLQRRGYGLEGGSPLVLRATSESTEPSADTPWPMQLGASKGSLRMRLFLFGPNSSGVLQDSREPTAGEFRVSLSLHDRRTRGYVWRGTATTCRCGQGMLASSRAMVAALVEAIGRSVAPKSAVFSASD